MILNKPFYLFLEFLNFSIFHYTPIKRSIKRTIIAELSSLVNTATSSKIFRKIAFKEDTNIFNRIAAYRKTFICWEDNE
ncbi:hypothetical protein CUU66_11685 [Peribacillus deserti]|uniref:Uncharacterized protein n=1 Tax=Peribacillus deserti TaxID=673318 RepID=A0A2N5M5Q3_9BACI|nr:hypothetical protein CUU66_11685 [Peribacillus deserti]